MRIAIVFFGLFLLLPGYLLAQEERLCQGSLGENIFDDGDFGSGSANTLATNPQIAPGYQYTRTGPPPDGLYTITNNTGAWPGLYSSWLSIRDNSSDPNGYMMVVNASFSTGTFYEKTITGLCESTIYEFSADIINLIARNIGGHILPNVSFFLNGEEQFSTGGIPQNESWITYGFTFETPPGVTEMTLTLRNNAPGGIGNDLALDNISFRACGASTFINTDQNIFLCEDANSPEPLTADIDIDNLAIQWQLSTDGGLNWFSIPGANGRQFFHNDFNVGSYQYRYLSSGSEANLGNFKCRVISDIITIDVLPLTYDFADTICTGINYQFGNQVLTQSGTYVETFISTRGCDSIVTLDLRVLPNNLDFSVNTTLPRCQGELNGLIEVAVVNNAFEPVVYDLEGLMSNFPVFNELAEGTYMVKVTDRFGCVSEQEVPLFLGDPFTIQVGPDLTLSLGETSDSINITANKNIASLSWSPEEFLSCTDCPNPSIVGGSSTSYIITAMDDNGCIALDTVDVIVITSDIRIFIPNAFSPNDDGINDFFYLNSFDQVIQEVSSLTIFDRWGGLVFQRKGAMPNIASEGWDGTFQGQMVEEGTYIYQFELQLIDGNTITQSGTITVIR